MSEQPQVAINRIYLKDLSFESPMAPDLFRGDFRPEVKIDLSVTPRELGDSLYEVSLEITVTGKVGEKNAFIVEVEQAGLFTLRGLEPAQMPHALRVFCPNLLFPYARQAIDNAMNLGSLPGLMLAPLNFEALLQSPPPP